MAKRDIKPKLKELVDLDSPLRLEPFQLATGMHSDELQKWHDTGKPPIDNHDVFYFGVTNKRVDNNAFNENTAISVFGPYGWYADKNGEHDLTVVFNEPYCKWLLSENESYLPLRMLLDHERQYINSFDQLLKSLVTIGNDAYAAEMGLTLLGNSFSNQHILPVISDISAIVVADPSVLKKLNIDFRRQICRSYPMDSPYPKPLGSGWDCEPEYFLDLGKEVENKGRIFRLRND